MRIFRKKLLKSQQRRGSKCTLSSAFLLLNAFYYVRKKYRCNISRCSSFAFAPIFHLRLGSFVDGGAEIFFALGRRVP